MPDQFWDAKDGVKGADLRKTFDDLNAFKAADDSRRLTLPQRPDDYKIALPKDFRAPDGIEFKLDEADPLYAQARGWAKENGLTQEAFEKGLGLLAASKVGEQSMIKTAREAELGKLGVNATARIDALATWLPSVVGDKAKGFVTVLKMAPVAETIEMLEGLMRKVQNTTTFSQQHRDAPPENGKIEGYSTMTFEQRRAEQDRQRAQSRR